MAGGHMTGLAWAGISNTWDEHQESRRLSDEFEEMSYERARRQRMLDRIRADEKREGKELRTAKEDKYDRWALGNDLTV